MARIEAQKRQIEQSLKEPSEAIAGGAAFVGAAIHETSLHGCICGAPRKALLGLAPISRPVP